MIKRVYRSSALMLAVGMLLSLGTASATEYGGQSLCTFRVPSVAVVTGQDEPQPGEEGYDEYVESLEMGGYGGPDPLLYDSFTGVWIDPVSGEAVASGGVEFGDVTDPKTKARFEIARGLWVDPETRIPLRDKRLNDVPYFDWASGESVDMATGARSPYASELLTIGASRQAAYNLRYACLGDDLSQRIDPVSGRYLKRPDGTEIDVTAFPSMNESNFERKIQYFMGERDAPFGFPRFNSFDRKFVRESFDLTNGESRNDVVAKIYAKMAPESAEGGGRYTLMEGRTIDDGLTVLVTATGLLDDAVSAEQIIVFFDTSMDGRARLMNAGIRRVCGRMGSHSGWTVERC